MSVSSEPMSLDALLFRMSLIWCATLSAALLLLIAL
jgi:hypothetical protein